MSNARIEIEAINKRWVGEIETFPPARRRTIRAETFEDCLAQIVAHYREIAPLTAQEFSAPPVNEVDRPNDEPALISRETSGEHDMPPEGAIAPKRGRHANACTCERCEFKRAAASRNAAPAA